MQRITGGATAAQQPGIGKRGEEGLVLSDMGSRNGVVLGGQLLTPKALVPLGARGVFEIVNLRFEVERRELEEQCSGPASTQLKATTLLGANDAQTEPAREPGVEASVLALGPAYEAYQAALGHVVGEIQNKVLELTPGARGAFLKSVLARYARLAREPGVLRLCQFAGVPVELEQSEPAPGAAALALDGLVELAEGYTGQPYGARWRWAASRAQSTGGTLRAQTGRPRRCRSTSRSPPALRQNPANRPLRHCSRTTQTSR